MRFFITKNMLVYLIALLLGTILFLLFVGCIPVTIRPQFDDKGLPIAIPVTPVGSVSMDGTLTPIYPVSVDSPKTTDWAAIGGGLAAVLSTLLAAYGINIHGLSKAKTAIKLVAELADKNAHAETDEEIIANKAESAKAQEAAGVRHLVSQARGK